MSSCGVSHARLSHGVDVRTNLYSQLGGDFLRSEVCFKGSFKVTKHIEVPRGEGLKPDRPYLR